MKKYLFLIFALIGVGLFSVTASIFTASRQFVQTAARTDGEVVRMIPKTSQGDTLYAPQVAFTAPNGEVITFVSGLSSSPPAHSTGDIVEVLYDPNNPTDARLSDLVTNYLGSTILFIFAFIFSLAGWIPFLVFLTRERREKWLKHNGMKITTTVKAVVQNKNYTLNGRHPWQIEAEAHTPNQTAPQKFTSTIIWKDPNEQVKVGDTVSIYIDPNKPERSVLDIDFLKKK